MDKGLYFISGPPRSGSALLAALLRRNVDIQGIDVADAGSGSRLGGPFELSKIFGFEQGGTVYSRAPGLHDVHAA